MLSIFLALVQLSCRFCVRMCVCAYVRTLASVLCSILYIASRPGSSPSLGVFSTIHHSSIYAYAYHMHVPKGYTRAEEE